MTPRKIRPFTRSYEISPENYGDPLGKVLADARAADLLGIPFTITTEHKEAFRNGGNVTKAQIHSYVITVGALTEAEA